LSLVVKRSVAIRGHRTSISLEQAFFDELTAIAAVRGMAVAALIAEIDAARPRSANLSSAIRLYVLEWVKLGGAARPADARPSLGR
jgi:predicted DNA-binding ribbon-helix-helix protein